jgi:hypothetical protein
MPVTMVSAAVPMARPDSNDPRNNPQSFLLQNGGFQAAGANASTVLSGRANTGSAGFLAQLFSQQASLGSYDTLQQFDKVKFMPSKAGEFTASQTRLARMQQALEMALREAKAQAQPSTFLKNAFTPPVSVASPQESAANTAVGLSQSTPSQAATVQTATNAAITGPTVELRNTAPRIGGRENFFSLNIKGASAYSTSQRSTDASLKGETGNVNVVL